MERSIDWEVLTAPVPPEEIRWRADGKPSNGRARVVAYTDSEFVRQRLDQACGQGGWRMELGPVTREVVGVKLDRNTGEEKKVRLYYVTCTLALLDDNSWVLRADVGQGKDPKEAVSDSLKRAAHRFGVAAELWRYPKNWGDVDERGNVLRVDGASPVAPERASTHTTGARAAQPARQQPPAQQSQAPARSPVPPCPTCNGPMYDNRDGKRNPKAPDFRCKNKSCVDDRGFTTGAWEEKAQPRTTARAGSKALVPANDDFEEFPDALRDDDDDLPF